MIATGGALDRAAGERALPGLLDRLREDPATAVLVVRQGRSPFSDEGRLAFIGAHHPSLRAASDPSATHWAFLGRRAAGGAILLASLADDADTSWHVRWGGVRDAAFLPVEEAETLVVGVALAGWLREASFCPACGTRTGIHQSGWSRRCPSCGREHFPRTDPAVIVAVESADGRRLLLGANAAWRGRMYSCFAGFVEAGESLETTVHREIEEEAGVRLRDVRYEGSQPWPFPRSLMVGFRATAIDEDLAHGDGEEIVDVRWFTREELGMALAGEGEVGLPGPASIARALIQDWQEGRT